MFRPIAIFGLIVFSANALAQSRDPYSEQITNAKNKEFLTELEIYHENVVKAYFALGCRVFPSEGAIGAMIYHYRADLYQDQMSRQPRTDPLSTILAEETKSKREGLAQATDQGCDFWRNNPDDVLRIRREAKNAVFRGPY